MASADAGTLVRQVRKFKEKMAMAYSKNLTIIAGTALAYFLTFELNAYLFSSLAYAPDVYWVCLPSGLQLAFILIFVESGAIGIAIATTILGLLHQPDADLITILGAGFFSGFAPWLARLICIARFNLDDDLKNLTPATLLAISMLFSLLPAVLQQLWYSCCGLTNDFLGTTTVMVSGALIGTIAMLYFAKLVLHVHSYSTRS
jgi:hypothetical protein